MMPRSLPIGFLLFLLAGLVVLNVRVYQDIFTPRTLELFVQEAGKGHTILLRTPSGVVTLINTGSDASILRILGNALPPWRRSIDVVVLTGASSATAGGLPEIMNRYRISNLVRLGALGSPSIEKALSATESASVPPDLLTAAYGARLVLGTTHLAIDSPDTVAISYGATALTISSTTPVGKYASNGVTTTYIK